MKTRKWINVSGIRAACCSMGTYSISARDVFVYICGVMLLYSVPASAQATFLRGDANMDNRVDHADAYVVINALFLSGEIVCVDSTDIKVRNMGTPLSD